MKEGQIVKEKLFSPVTKHLKQIENKLQSPSSTKIFSKKNKEDTIQSFKEEEKEDDGLSNHEDLSMIGNFSMQTPELNRQCFSTPKEKKKNVSVHRLSKTSDDIKKSILQEIDDDEEKSLHNSTLLMQKTFNDITEESFRDYLSQYDPLPRKYIHEMLTDEKHEFDHKYGVRHNPDTEKFYIGNSQLKINGSNFIIQNKVYKGTKGLYELLFKKRPKNFTINDEQTYKEIVIKTNAHRRYYHPQKQIDGSKLDKYKKIISKIEGKGMLMEVTNNKLDYIYWDDPNELVQRLRLLIASEQAGNNSHQNEINSLIEELQEAQIIR